jgi:hypothetical protein
MILKIFSPKNLAKILALFAQTTASVCKNVIITLFFEKNANCFAENWQKSQKIAIITSTPGVVVIVSANGTEDRGFDVYGYWCRASLPCIEPKILPIRNRIFHFLYLTEPELFSLSNVLDSD